MPRKYYTLTGSVFKINFTPLTDFRIFILLQHAIMVPNSFSRLDVGVKNLLRFHWSVNGEANKQQGCQYRPITGGTADALLQ